MTNAKSCLEPAQVVCPRPLPTDCGKHCDFNLNTRFFKENQVKNNSSKFALLRWLLPILIAVILSGCAGTGTNRLMAEGRIGTSISSVSHYGNGIGIGDFYVNGGWGGVQYNGWGGGGKTVCCVSFPRTTSTPVMVTVKWKTYRTGVTEERWHEATVPVNFAVPIGKSDGMVVHFLPGHRVEIWFADEGIGSPNYPGPAYPSGPAPDYVPLPDEKPEPAKGK
jgi:hypothetical protein